MIKNRRTPRFYIRLGCLILAILLVWPGTLWIYHSKWLVQASPFVLICAVIAGGKTGMGALPGLVFLIASVFRKRWFCRYICPVGLILDNVPGAGKKRNTWWRNFPSIGKYIVLITAAGSLISYPLFLWMDPLVFLNSAVSSYNATNIIQCIIMVSGLAFLIILTIASNSLWCARICPPGATQDLLSEIKSLPDRLSGKKNNKINGPESVFSFPVTRRGIFAIAIGAGLGFMAKTIGQARADSEILRPPGAIEEDKFTGQCLRCGNCMSTCPSKIIKPDIGKTGILGFMTPVLSYKKGYCLETCNDCTNVCPSGALGTMPLSGKIKYSIGKAYLNSSLCYMVKGVNDCDICVRSCPFDAVQIYWDDESYVALPFIELQKCNGCGACEHFCPTVDIKAIVVRRFVEE